MSFRPEFSFYGIIYLILFKMFARLKFKSYQSVENSLRKCHVKDFNLHHIDYISTCSLCLIKDLVGKQAKTLSHFRDTEKKNSGSPNNEKESCDFDI